MTGRPPRRGFTAAQVAEVLARHDAGQKVPEICRRYRISERTFYLWRRRRAEASAAPPKPAGGRAGS